ncbi:MAG: DUF721 domain-containing protein [Dongiaceae bacterium]
MVENDTDRKTSDRSWRTQSLGSLLPKVARPVLGRHGLAAGGIVADWPSIVGTQLAECCVPMRLAFPPGERSAGTLHLRVQGSLALELQHLEPVVLERINSYFGYRAVVRLRIQQGPVPRPVRRQEPAAAGNREDPAIDALVDGIGDEELRRRLSQFGRALKARKPL